MLRPFWYCQRFIVIIYMKYMNIHIICMFSTQIVYDSLPLSICINKSLPPPLLLANIFIILVCAESYILDVLSIRSCILIFDMIYHRYCLIIFLRLAWSKIDQEFVKFMLEGNFVVRQYSRKTFNRSWCWPLCNYRR